MKFIAIAAAATAFLPAALAFCCGSSIGGQCADGTNGTPCCATESCNIFCCACGGHCRGTSKRDLTPSFDIWARDELMAFHLADVDNKGNLTLSEYLNYMQVDGTPDLWVNWFNKHDANQDGVITADEVRS